MPTSSTEAVCESKFNVMCFKVPMSWDQPRLMQEIQKYAPVSSVELFKLKGDERQHAGTAVVRFSHTAGVDSLFEQCKWTTSPKHGEQYELFLSGARLALKRERLNDRGFALEQMRLKAEAGMKTQKVQVNCVDGNTTTVGLGVPHIFTVKIVNKQIYSIPRPEFKLVPFQREFRWELDRTHQRSSAAAEKRAPAPEIKAEGGTCCVKVHFTPQGSGRFGEFRTVLLLNFGERGAYKVELQVNVEDPDLAAAAAEIETSQRTAPVWDGVERRIIPAFHGARPNASHLKTPDDVVWQNALGEYPIPERLQEDIDNLERTSFNAWRTRDNFVERTHTLLYIEEAQQVKNFRKFDLSGVKLHPSTEGGVTWHKMSVQGLAERRPSVLKGDSVYVWVPGTQDVEYEGFVQEVLRDAAWLQLNPCFSDATRGVPEFNVRFRFSRMQFRRMHAAVDNANLSLVWPEATTHAVGQPSDFDDDAVDFSVSAAEWSPNKEQRRCVQRIVALSRAPCKAPFLIRGAFGTGKTSTICQAVVQLLRRDASARVLLCTECNAAADLYIDLLANKLEPSTMLRYYQAHRKVSSSTTWRYCEALYDEENKIFRTPKLAEVQGYRLIVCTFDNSSVLWGIGCPKGTFSHIIMDEAANALEARALIPLQLADESTVIVAAGDDRQIAPQVHSPSARYHGLKESMLVRMAGLEFYQMAPHAYAELLVNYRSHPRLLELPSKLFYQGRLKAGADPKKVSSLCGWKRLPKEGLPLLFIGVEGKDERAEDSPGFINRAEASQIVSMIEKLRAQCSLEMSDIAVVSAFHRQSLLIRQLLKRKDLAGVDVGGIENIQGMEKKAVFVSVVRARKTYVEYDKRHGLGFLFDEKKLNTALTRASSLLVLVADPYIAHEEKHWKQLIQECEKLGCYEGPDFTDASYLKSRTEQEEQDNLQEHEKQSYLRELSEKEAHAEALADEERKQEEEERNAAALRTLVPTNVYMASKARPRCDQTTAAPSAASSSAQQCRPQDGAAVSQPQAPVPPGSALSPPTPAGQPAATAKAQPHLQGAPLQPHFFLAPQPLQYYYTAHRPPPHPTYLGNAYLPQYNAPSSHIAECRPPYLQAHSHGSNAKRNGGHAIPGSSATSVLESAHAHERPWSEILNLRQFGSLQCSSSEVRPFLSFKQQTRFCEQPSALLSVCVFGLKSNVERQGATVHIAISWEATDIPAIDGTASAREALQQIELRFVPLDTLPSNAVSVVSEEHAVKLYFLIP